MLSSVRRVSLPVCACMYTALLCCMCYAVCTMLHVLYCLCYAVYAMQDICSQVSQIETRVNVVWENGEKEEQVSSNALCQLFDLDGVQIPARDLIFGSLGPHGVLPNDVVCLASSSVGPSDSTLGSVTSASLNLCVALRLSISEPFCVSLCV